jgi:hypothetical protein
MLSCTTFMVLRLPLFPRILAGRVAKPKDHVEPA